MRLVSSAFDGLLVRTPDSAVTNIPVLPRIDPISQLRHRRSVRSRLQIAVLRPMKSLRFASSTRQTRRRSTVAFEGHLWITLRRCTRHGTPSSGHPMNWMGSESSLSFWPRSDPLPRQSSATPRACGGGNVDALKASRAAPGGRRDVNSLLAVADTLSTMYALIIEPMQSKEVTAMAYLTSVKHCAYSPGATRCR